jgi:hypothetical protein
MQELSTGRFAFKFLLERVARFPRTTNPFPLISSE